MRQNFLINITGKQTVEGEEGEIELTTFASYIIKGKTKYIVYNEYDEYSPVKKVTSILKIDGSRKVTLIRHGDQLSRLTLEKGKRHQCHYETGFGSLMVGVFANNIYTNLTDQGGTLEIDYSLDINAGLTSKNQIRIDIKGTSN